MRIIIVALKEKKVLSQSPEYEEIDKPKGKATDIHYAVSSQALSVKDKTNKKVPPQYDYASTGPISVSEKTNYVVIVFGMYTLYVCNCSYNM